MINGWQLTKSAEIQAEAPLSVDVLKLLFKHFDVADRVEHDMDDNWQRHKAGDSHPGCVQQVCQCHELDTGNTQHTQSVVDLG